MIMNKLYRDDTLSSRKITHVLSPLPEVAVACCMSFICSALVIADPVSFICSTLPSTMSDYNDNDDSSKVEELDMDGTPKATQKKKVLSDGYNRPPISVLQD